MGGAASMGAVALLVGYAIGVGVANPRPPEPVPVNAASFPTALLGQERVSLEVRDGGVMPVHKDLDANFEDQIASYQFAYGGPGATFHYGSRYTLTIVNGLLAVSVPTAGDPPSGDVPTVVSLRSPTTSCVSQQPIVEFERRPLTRQSSGKLPEDPESHRVAAGPGTGGRSAWTHCVLVDRERNLALELFGDGPAHDILTTAGKFRDELERIHADLVG